MSIKESPSIAASDASEGFSNRFMFMLVAASSAVGFGNVWRFPYLTYKNGGLAFIIIYIIALALISVPLIILEIGLGQVLRGGQSQVWGKIGRHCRAPAIMGWTSFTILFFYPLLMAWSMGFFVNSFTSNFGWATDITWETQCAGFQNQIACTSLPYCEWRDTNCALDVLYNSKEFFRNELYAFGEVDGRDKGLKLDRMSWKLVVYGLIAWVGTFGCVFAGARVLGYTTYLTMTSPAILMVALVIITATFEGSATGVAEYIAKFNINSVNQQTMIDAVNQGIFSLTLGQGCLSTISSHNAPRDNFVENALVVVVADTVFAILSGFAVYAVIGFLAFKANLPVSKLEVQSIGLAFTAYPAAIAQLPRIVSTVVAILFFFILWFLGFSTVCTLVEGLILPIINSRLGKKYRVKRWHATATICAFFFFGPGLLISTSWGYSFLVVADDYSALAQGLCGALQCIIVGWIYIAGDLIKRVGQKAYYIHTFTFLGAPILMGIFDKIHVIPSLIVGLVLPVVGFLTALYLFDNSQDSEASLTDPPLSLQKKAYALTIENVEAIRYALNDAIANKRWISIPQAWSYCIKYLIPYVLLYLSASSITSRERILDKPSATVHYPLPLIILAAISPILMLLSYLLVSLYPDLILWFLPDNVENQKVFGSEYYPQHKAKQLEA